MNTFTYDGLFVGNQFLDDMEIYSNIFDKIDNTITSFGKSTLKYKLKYIADDTLGNVINGINYIHTNKQFKNYLTTSLKTIKKYMCFIFFSA